MPLNHVVLDIPHGGKITPPEALPHLHPGITHIDLMHEADLYSQGFYRQQPGIPASNKIFFDYFRAIVDMNRNFDDFRRDGIVKKITSRGKQLFRDPNGMPEEVRSKVIEKYAKPYSSELSRAVEQPSTRLVILCHTMDPIGQSHGLTPGIKRPLVNLANGGDKLGNSDPDRPYQVSREIMEFIKDEIESRVSRLNLNDAITDGRIVSFNDPYPGKKSIDRIGPERLSGKKAVMFELNKSIVTGEDTLMEFHSENIAVIRQIIHDVIEGVLGRLTR